MRIQPLPVILITCTILLGAAVRDAFAYIDPGTGSYILQIVIAAFIGGLVTLKVFWSKITRFFKGMFGREEK